MSKSFLDDVDAMFDKAAGALDLPEGVAEKIKVCNATYVTRFGVRLRGKMVTFRGWRAMGADTVRKPMVNRRDLNVGFQDAKAALDICQRLIARDGVSRDDLGDIGQQDELAIKEGRARDGLFINVPTEPIRRQIRLDEAGEFGIGDGADKAAVGSPV